MKKVAIAVLIPVFVALMPVSPKAGGIAENADSGMDAFLDDLSARVSDYSDLKNWRAAVRSSVTEMDKNWKPEKTTVVRKITTVTESRSREEILEVLETEKGTTKDITKTYIQEVEERRRKAEERRRDSARDRERSGGRRDMSVADLAPFSRENRIKYSFSFLPDAEVSGRPARVLSAEARAKDSEVFEGRYYIDRETLDVLRVELRPSKNPRFVKHLEMDIRFQPGIGSLALKASQMKIHAGFLLKTMRLVVEEEYTDFEILDPAGS
jgi:hypothetical protein